MFKLTRKGWYKCRLGVVAAGAAVALTCMVAGIAPGGGMNMVPGGMPGWLTGTG
jgi:hypothetical protein